MNTWHICYAVFATLNTFDRVTGLLLGFIYYGGAVVLAGIFGCLAMRKPEKSQIYRIALWAIAIFFLLIQGGCWVMATGFQRLQ